METASAGYEIKVRKALAARGLPEDGWYCEDVEDNEDDDFVCELCGCTRVRFIHHMKNFFTRDELLVGCICAGAMEGNIEAARDREREMKNRAARKRNFPNRSGWKYTRNGGRYIDHCGKRIFINKSRSGGYRVNCGGSISWIYKGQTIRDFTTACYCAFDMAEGV